MPSQSLKIAQFGSSDGKSLFSDVNFCRAEGVFSRPNLPPDEKKVKKSDLFRAKAVDSLVGPLLVSIQTQPLRVGGEVWPRKL
jgi:hypothetical protein